MATPTGCFLVGATGPRFSKNGDAFIGSVSDNPYDVRTFVKAVRPTKGLAHVGTELVSTTEHSLTERGYFARPGETTRGVNEAGLAFTCAMVIENEDAEVSGTPTAYADITEKMMNTCESVEDALALFQSEGKAHPAYSVLLADAKGDLAHIEVGNFGIAVNHHFSRSNPGAVFAVNCYLSSTLVNHNAPHTLLSNLENNNSVRLERGRQLAKGLRGELSVRTLAGLLSDHANREHDPMENPILEAWGYSICNHGTRSKDTYPHEDLPWGTVSAEIMEPSAGLFWYAYGWPCGAKPEFGDQLFQGNSWGRFVPFGVQASGEGEPGVTVLSTTSGEITAAGVRYQFTQVATGVVAG